MKKIILCVTVFISFSTFANFLSSTSLLADEKNLSERLAKHESFNKMISLSFKLIQKVEKTRSLELIQKYHKKDIKSLELNRLLTNLGFSNESQFLDEYKRIFECRNNVLKAFPELKGKNRQELTNIVFEAGKNKISDLAKYDVAKINYPMSSCWAVWSSAMFFCFVNYDIESEDYAICMALAWDSYGICSLFAN